MTTSKYALLDTDFLSKLHITQNKKGEYAIEQVLKFPGYRFLCHEQTEIELDRHDGFAKEWLSEKIKEKVIVSYSDEQLILELQSVYGKLAFAHYTGMLKNSCDTYSARLYDKYYSGLMDLAEDPDTEIVVFIQKLQECDLAVGEDNNLGEIKLFTMAQVLYLLRNDNLFVFCSDDRKARIGIINVNYGVNIECVSALAVFLLLKEILCMDKADAKEFFDSWMTYHKAKNQSRFKVYNNTRAQQLMKVDGYDIFDAIYDDKFGLVKDGHLKLKDNKNINNRKYYLGWEGEKSWDSIFIRV